MRSLSVVPGKGKQVAWEDLKEGDWVILMDSQGGGPLLFGKFVDFFKEDVIEPRHQRAESLCGEGVWKAVFDTHKYADGFSRWYDWPIKRDIWIVKAHCEETRHARKCRKLSDEEALGWLI